jgi:hypothetical protein
MSNLYISTTSGEAAAWASLEAKNEKPQIVYTPTAARIAAVLFLSFIRFTAVSFFHACHCHTIPDKNQVPRPAEQLKIHG